MTSWIGSLFLRKRESSARSCRSQRFIPQIEELSQRIVPDAVTTKWTNGLGDGLWSTAANWGSSETTLVPPLGRSWLPNTTIKA